MIHPFRLYLESTAKGGAVDLVGMTGFEPATSSSRTKRATGLRYIPMWGVGFRGEKKLLNLTQSHQADLNRRPTHYECVALPAELWWLLVRNRILYIMPAPLLHQINPKLGRCL